MPENPSLIPQPLSAPFLRIVLLPALWEPQAHPCDPLELVPLRSALRGCSLACSLHARVLAPASSLRLPYPLSLEMEKWTPGTGGQCVSVPEFQRPWPRETRFPEVHNSLAPFLHTFPELNSVSLPTPVPFCQAQSRQPGMHLGSRYLGCSHWGASLGKSQVEAIEFQLQLSEKKNPIGCFSIPHIAPPPS